MSEIKEKQRTIQQNKALWLYFTQLADALSIAGLDMRKVLKPEIEIPWTKQSIHDYLWVPVLKAQLGKRSTTEMTTKDIDLVFETITRHLAEKFGLVVNFPSIETQINESRI